MLLQHNSEPQIYMYIFSHSRDDSMQFSEFLVYHIESFIRHGNLLIHK